MAYMQRLIGTFVLLAVSLSPAFAMASRPIDVVIAHPPIHIKGEGKGVTPAAQTPSGYTPAQVKAAYNLPAGGGSGTIAIVDAFNASTVERDLQTFSSQFNLPSCTTKNGCLEIHPMSGQLRTVSNWALETALDTQWAHAIAPSAKILLVEAASDSAADLLNAVDYARSRPDVVAISMSWGAPEFQGETQFDSHFTGKAFFASSGDAGAGVEWPAVSSNVIGVGGTTLSLSGGKVIGETAWSGSGGGLSLYEAAPAFQEAFGIPQANGFRAVPDVSYNADPNTGYAVYFSNGTKGWFVIGGTSAGAPQWAAMKAQNASISASRLYADAASSTLFFRDISQGSNGSCGFFCTAATGYDYITGLGSPLTVSY